MKRAAKIYTALIFVFLFAPIVILLVFSFNEAKSLSVFSGFSLKWYQELFRDGETLNALKNTLILAVIASVVSTAMGTAAAVGMNKLRSKYLRAALDTATDIPMMNPDIITGISLMLMFVFFGRLLDASTSLGFWSMLAAHITFCLPYVIMQVLPKLQQMDRALPEAAMDLGCTPVRAFFRVEVPEILPGIMPRVIAEISARTQVPVIVLRDASLEEHDVTLVFRFAENEYFKPGYTGLTERTLHITDRLLEPGNWSQQYFGTYGPVKHQLMIDWTGEVWDESYIRSLLNGDSGYLSYLKEFFQQKLEEENAKRQEAGLDIYREADGSEIRF